MPVLSNPVPVDRPGSGSAPLDDSLTSLHWLQNFSILGADPERPTGTGPESPSPQNRLPRTGTDPPCSPAAGDTAGDPGSPLASALVPVQSGPVELDFRTNPRAKPPFSYASLICMSMQASQQPKVTLSTIYNWITDNFCYYRHAEPSWQNSIRHNLSLNKCFKKVPRRKDEPGKGGFWQIDPQYADMFVNGIFKRRRMSANHYGGGGGTHRQNRQVQVYHNSHSACPYQVGGKWKQHSKAMRAMESPLLAMEANKADFLKGEFDLTSVFDDVLAGGCSTFEDLDINTALSSLGCETEVSMLGRQHSAGRWCGAGDVSHRQSCGYLDPSGALAESYVNLGELGAPQRPEQDQLPQGHLPLQHFDESAALFAEPPGDGVLQPWEVIKEEPQVTALTLDQGFGLYEGFFTEMQQWERVESFL